VQVAGWVNFESYDRIGPHDLTEIKGDARGLNRPSFDEDQKQTTGVVQAAVSNTREI
jgi:hypothetical protein